MSSCNKRRRFIKAHCTNLATSIYFFAAKHSWKVSKWTIFFLTKPVRYMQLQSFQTFDGLHAEVILPRYANCAQNYNKRTSLGLPGSEKKRQYYNFDAVCKAVINDADYRDILCETCCIQFGRRYFCWRCPNSMRSRVYVMVGRPSVRLSVRLSVS